MPKKPKDTATQAGEYVPSADELELEWEKKLKGSKGADTGFVADTAPRRRAESLDEVFTQLKETEAPAARRVEKQPERLEKISGVVRGEAPEVKERELMGGGVPGIYRLYPMGGIPPLNLLSKGMGGIASKSLDSDLKRSNIPLYPNEYASFAVGLSFILSVLVFVGVFLLMSDLVFALIAFVVALMLFSLLLVTWPSMHVGAGSRDVERQLPFALRHMSALLSAGISIFDSLVSVSKANYGSLSMEIDKVVWDVKSGENISDALEDASDRIGSHSFNRVTIHIRRALQMGGDVAGIISQIADDLTFEMRMKVSDFVEKLNAFAIVYLIGGIVGPVVIAVFSVVSSARPLQEMGGAAFVSQSMLIFMVLFLFPLLMALITYVVKLMEPKV